MQVRTANDLMDAYNDLSDKEKAAFKKRFKELLSFEKSLRIRLKSLNK